MDAFSIPVFDERDQASLFHNDYFLEEAWFGNLEDPSLIDYFHQLVQNHIPMYQSRYFGFDIDGKLCNNF